MLNHHQRVVMYVALSVLLVLIFLHSPWTGYYENSTFSPLVRWLGPLENLAASITLVVFLSGLWIWFSRTPSAKGPSGDA